jgi:hypothetical protein
MPVDQLRHVDEWPDESTLAVIESARQCTETYERIMGLLTGCAPGPRKHPKRRQRRAMPS